MALVLVHETGAEVVSAPAIEGVPLREPAGRPWQNGVVESFHSRLRDECLDREWLASIAEAAVLLEQYRRAYNTTHLHSSLNYQTPTEARANYDTRVDSGFSQSESHKPEIVSV